MLSLLVDTREWQSLLHGAACYVCTCTHTHTHIHTHKRRFKSYLPTKAALIETREWRGLLHGAAVIEKLADDLHALATGDRSVSVTEVSQ